MAWILDIPCSPKNTIGVDVDTTTCLDLNFKLGYSILTSLS